MFPYYFTPAVGILQPQAPRDPVSPIWCKQLFKLFNACIGARCGAGKCV